MLTMGIDIGSRSSKCVILEDGKLLTYGSIETGPTSSRRPRRWWRRPLPPHGHMGRVPHAVARDEGRPPED